MQRQRNARDGVQNQARKRDAYEGFISKQGYIAASISSPFTQSSMLGSNTGKYLSPLVLSYVEEHLPEDEIEPPLSWSLGYNKLTCGSKFDLSQRLRVVNSGLNVVK